MKALIFCVVAILFVSCHTQKQTTTATKVVETTESVARQQQLISMLDSMHNTLDFSADSMVMHLPTVVAVNGKDSVVSGTLSLFKPYITNTVAQVNKRQVDSSLALDVHVSGDSTTDIKETSDNVVVAEPVSWWAVLLLCAALLMLLLYWRKIK